MDFSDWTDNELIRTKSRLIADRHKLRDEFLESGPWVGLTGRELAEMRVQISREIEALNDEIIRRSNNGS